MNLSFAYLVWETEFNKTVLKYLNISGENAAALTPHHTFYEEQPVR